MASLDSLFTGYHFTITQLSSCSIAIFRLNAAVKKKTTNKRKKGVALEVLTISNAGLTCLYYVCIMLTKTLGNKKNVTKD